MIQRIADRKEEIEELSGELGDMEQKLADAEAAVKEAKGKLSEANETLKAIRVVRDLRQKDHDYYRNLLDFKQMEERKARIDGARVRAKGAGAILERIRVTDDILGEILEVERERDSAIAQLEVGAPSLILASLKDIDLKVDGKKVKLKSGQEELRTVTDEMSVLVPDVLEIKVAPGTSSGGLARQLQEAEEKLTLILEENEVKDSADARRQIQAWEKAGLQIEEVKEVERQDLRDLTYEELTGRIEGLKEGTATYLEDRVKSPLITDNQDLARLAQQETEEELEEAEEIHERADNSHRATEENRNALREQIAEGKGAAGNLARDLEGLEKELKVAREETSDNALEEKVAEIQKAADEKRGVIGLKREELSRLNPEQVRALVESSTGSLKTAEERHKGLETEEIDLKARLSVRGEEGLHEQIQAVEGDLFRKQRDNRSLFRRAAAVRLLYKTMEEERDSAYESYKAPFKEKVEQLGRLVYNDSFQIFLNDNLSIKERVLNGIKVPFDSLSGGAKEQVSILTRIAAAMLVAEDKPIPIVIDDALGYTSPKRLKFMGAALAQAGKAGQVIVLTCTPERYAHLGEVTLVSMD